MKDFHNQLKAIFENVQYDTSLREEDEPTIDYIYQDKATNTAYTIKVEPGETEFNVLDKTGKVLDIFLPSMVDQDGGVIKKQLRQAIFNDYQQNHGNTQEQGDDQDAGVNESTLEDKKGQAEVNKMTGLNVPQSLKEEKNDPHWEEHAVKHKGRFTEYCKKNGFEGPCEECAAHAMKSNDASVRGMAEFYRNVKK